MRPALGQIRTRSRRPIATPERRSAVAVVIRIRRRGNCSARAEPVPLMWPGVVWQEEGMRARGQDSSNEAVGKSVQPEMPGPGKRTLTEQAYNQPVAVAQQPPQHRTEQAQPQPNSTGPTPGDMSTDGSTSNAPVASYIIPFDRNPKSSPGEQVILGAVFTDPKPNDYQLVYTCAGGEFNAAGSGSTSQAFPGISKRNLNFYIDSKWDKKSAVTVKLELQKVADKSVVQT